MIERFPGTCTSARLLVGSAVLLGFFAGTSRAADDLWGGSVALTSDYFVRGISRSDDHAALQLDLHYVNISGFVAGLFASNAKIDPSEPEDVLLSGFLGYAWSAGNDWHGKVLASYYSYPWNALGSQYNYDELDLDVAYQDWAGVSLTYSSNSPRYLPNRGLTGVTAKSAELNLQRPVPALSKLSGTAGVGYYYLQGPGVTGYVYWSLGAAYDLAPVSLTLSYVDTTAGANALFYNAAAGGRWTGTVIWRF
jgi:uncharacterized protein (TIGR02001 family)